LRLKDSYRRRRGRRALPYTRCMFQTIYIYTYMYMYIYIYMYLFLGGAGYRRRRGRRALPYTRCMFTLQRCQCQRYVAANSACCTV